MTRDAFDGKVVFITGAASGIGRALAGALSKRGAVLLLADIEADMLERAAWALGGECKSRSGSHRCRARCCARRR